jgi:hypothetical protein
MKVIISLTTIPSRFDKLNEILPSLLGQACHEVWLNIPPKYNRFPGWDGQVPDFSKFGPKLVVNRNCQDLGPGTKFLGPAPHLDKDDLIVYVDDDTNYDTKLAMNLLKWWKTDPTSAWGLSGFNFETYFQKFFPRQHGVPLDVLEGYGSVLVKAGWIQKIAPEFKELLELTWHDDMILCNLFEKYEINRKTVFTPECNVGNSLRQFQYGFASDALHNVAGEGGHMSNNLKILKSFEDKGKLYYKYKCS